MAENVVKTLAEPHMQKLISCLQAAGCRMTYIGTAVEDDRFAGQTFVLTGTLPTLKRKDAEAMILRCGGKVSGSVSKKTSFVVAGEAAGSKLEKANALGIPILTEAAFLDKIQGKDASQNEN